MLCKQAKLLSENNPQEVLHVPLHPEKCTVWCALHAGGIIGPYSFKNYAGTNVTVNGARNRSMINEYLFKNLNGIDQEVFWFQQDGGTPHAVTVTIDLLRERFGDNIISRNGPVNWPPRSCDITPLDYFLWGYVKSLVYADKPETIDALEANITHVIDEIMPELLEKVVQNLSGRMRFLRASRGGHMPENILET